MFTNKLQEIKDNVLSFSQSERIERLIELSFSNDPFAMIETDLIQKIRQANGEIDEVKKYREMFPDEEENASASNFNNNSSICKRCQKILDKNDIIAITPDYYEVLCERCHNFKNPNK